MIENWNDLSHLLPDSALKLAVAMLCGFILGFERERRDKPAGLRTILLITTGSTLFMIVSNLIPLVTDWPADTTRVDPSRIASQVVTGVGFLGAGSIIQSRGAVHGLTTAAVIWVAAGVGLCVGIGFPLLAVILTVIVVAALVLMNPVRRWLTRRDEQETVELVIRNDDLLIRLITYTLAEHDLEADALEVRPGGEDRLLVRIRYRVASAASAARMLDVLSRMDGVRGMPYAE